MIHSHIFDACGECFRERLKKAEADAAWWRNRHEDLLESIHCVLDELGDELPNDVIRVLHMAVDPTNYSREYGRETDSVCPDTEEKKT